MRKGEKEKLDSHTQYSNPPSLYLHYEAPLVREVLNTHGANPLPEVSVNSWLLTAIV